jgi:hypothetical protein
LGRVFRIWTKLHCQIALSQLFTRLIERTILLPRTEISNRRVHLVRGLDQSLLSVFSGASRHNRARLIPEISVRSGLF